MVTNSKIEKVYSILELNSAVKSIIRREFQDMVWVHGEIQDYNKNRHKQHIFFRLCEKHPEIDEIIAQVTVVIYESIKEKLAFILGQAENRFELQDDIEVKFLCRIDFYAKTGSFELIVESIDPVYTLGKLAQNKQKIINELKVKGILDKNKGLAFPLVPLCIGLITSYNSAAFHDFTSELRKSGYGFKIKLFDSSMQGKNVEQDICRALDFFNKCDIDAVAITRGGGSTADLSWFDNAKIAEKISSSRVPVLSGIGHEINITIADLSSYIYMKTPTAIAQYFIKNIENFLLEIEDKIRKIIVEVNSQIQNNKQELGVDLVNAVQITNSFLKTHREDIVNKVSILRLSTKNLISQNKTKVLNLGRNLSLYSNQMLKNFKMYIFFSKEKITPRKLHNILLRLKIELTRREEMISRISGNIIKFLKEFLKGKQAQIRLAPINILKSAEQSIRNYENAIKIADPLNTVKRGFSITKTESGKTVRSIKDVRAEECIITTVSDGNIQSKVKKGGIHDG